MLRQQLLLRIDLLGHLFELLGVLFLLFFELSLGLFPQLVGVLEQLGDMWDIRLGEFLSLGIELRNFAVARDVDQPAGSDRNRLDGKIDGPLPQILAVAIEDSNLGRIVLPFQLHVAVRTRRANNGEDVSVGIDRERLELVPRPLASNFDVADLLVSAASHIGWLGVFGRRTDQRRKNIQQEFAVRGVGRFFRRRHFRWRSRDQRRATRNQDHGSEQTSR